MTHSRMRGRRAVVFGESVHVSADWEPPVVEKSPEEHAFLVGELTANILFSGMDPDSIAIMASAMKKKVFDEGSVIIKQGDVGDYYYIIAEGNATITVNGATVLQAKAGMGFGKFIIFLSTPLFCVLFLPFVFFFSFHTIHTSDCDSLLSHMLSCWCHNHNYSRYSHSFSSNSNTCTNDFVFPVTGELALLYGAPRAATVTATGGPVSTWALDRLTFKSVVMGTIKKKREKYEGFLRKVPILSTLMESEILTLADALELVQVKAGTVVVHQGDTEVDRFYIVEEGELAATIDGMYSFGVVLVIYYCCLLLTVFRTQSVCFLFYE